MGLVSQIIGNVGPKIKSNYDKASEYRDGIMESGNSLGYPLMHTIEIASNLKWVNASSAFYKKYKSTTNQLGDAVIEKANIITDIAKVIENADSKQATASMSGFAYNNSSSRKGGRGR